MTVEGKKLNAFAVYPEDLTIVGLDTKLDLTHRLHDERIELPIEPAFVKNIKYYGVIEPIIVRKIGDVIEVVDGRQRVRAARVANAELKAAGHAPLRVPIVIRRSSEDMLGGVMISANEHRRGDEFQVKLQKLERYLAHGKSEEDAAIAFGVGVGTIHQWLSILEASPEVKKAVNLNRLSTTAAAKLATLPREQQVEALAELTAEGTGKATIEKAERVRKAKKNGISQDSVPVAPSRKEIKWLVKDDGSALGMLKGHTQYIEGFYTALTWVIGRLQTQDVEGLAEALQQARKK